MPSALRSTGDPEISLPGVEATGERWDACGFVVLNRCTVLRERLKIRRSLVSWLVGMKEVLLLAAEKASGAGSVPARAAKAPANRKSRWQCSLLIQNYDVPIVLSHEARSSGHV